MSERNETKDMELTPELAALERQLARLTVASLHVDRDRLMFAAGRAAARPGYLIGPSWADGWFWPAATATMTAATLLLSTMLFLPTAPPSVAREAKPKAGVEQAVAVDVPASPASATEHMVPWGWNWGPQAASGYLGLRNAALARGVGAIEFETLSANGHAAPADDAPRLSPTTARELLDELMPRVGSPTETSS